MSVRDALAKLVLGQDLSREEANSAMRSLVEGEATPSQIAAFAIALRMKGETPDEIAGLAEVMRDAATRVNAGSNVVDVVGTGGDGAGIVADSDPPTEYQETLNKAHATLAAVAEAERMEGRVAPVKLEVVA